MPATPPETNPAPTAPDAIVYPTRSRRTGWLILGLVLLALLGAGAWYVLRPPTRENADTGRLAAPALTRTNEPTPEPAPSVSNEYVNSDYGFKLTLGEKWKGYQVVSKDPDDANASAYLYFCLPTQDASWKDEKPGYYCPFAVTAVPANRWDNFLAENEPRVPTLLGTNASYALAYSTAQAAPSDGQELLQAVKAVVGSFSTTEATGLKKYTNGDFKISFRYPTDWKLSEQVDKWGEESDPQRWLQVSLTTPDGDRSTIYTGSIPGRGGPCYRYSYQLTKVDEQVAITDTAKLEDDPEGMCATNSPGVSGGLVDSAGETTLYFEYSAQSAELLYLKRSAALIESISLQ